MTAFVHPGSDPLLLARPYWIAIQKDTNRAKPDRETNNSNLTGELWEIEKRIKTAQTATIVEIKQA